MLNNRIHDKFVTPSELIHNNFSDNEVQLIRSDPEYFKPKNYEEQLDSVDILKKRKLLDVLNTEEINQRQKKQKSLSTISISMYAYIKFRQNSKNNKFQLESDNNSSPKTLGNLSWVFKNKNHKLKSNTYYPEKKVIKYESFIEKV